MVMILIVCFYILVRCERRAPGITATKSAKLDESENISIVIRTALPTSLRCDVGM